MLFELLIHQVIRINSNVYVIKVLLKNWQKFSYLVQKWKKVKKRWLTKHCLSRNSQVPNLCNFKEVFSAIKNSQWMDNKDLLSKYEALIAHWSIFNNLYFNYKIDMSALSTLFSIQNIFYFIPLLILFACSDLVEQMRVSERKSLRGKSFGKCINITQCTLKSKRKEDIIWPSHSFLPSQIYPFGLKTNSHDQISRSYSFRVFNLLLSTVPSSNPSQGSAA